MKLKKLSIALAVAAVLASSAALAGYNHDIMNPDFTGATAAANLPSGCKILADDTTNQRPIFINCSDVVGLGSSPLAGNFTTIVANSTITGGSASNIAINTNKFTVAASSGNTVVGGTLGVTGVTTATGGLVSQATNDLSPTFSTGITANPVVMTTKGTCTVAAVNGGTCIPLAGVAARTITVTGFDIVAAGSAATCTGVLLEDTNNTPVVIATLAAATLTSAAHNVPLAATLGVGFGGGTGLTAAKGVQIIKNGSDCATTTAFTYTINYAIQ